MNSFVFVMIHHARASSQSTLLEMYVHVDL